MRSIISNLRAISGENTARTKYLQNAIFTAVQAMRAVFCGVSFQGGKQHGGWRSKGFEDSAPNSVRIRRKGRLQCPSLLLIGSEQVLL